MRRRTFPWLMTACAISFEVACAPPAAPPAPARPAASVGSSEAEAEAGAASAASPPSAAPSASASLDASVDAARPVAVRTADAGSAAGVSALDAGGPAEFDLDAWLASHHVRALPADGKCRSPSHAAEQGPAGNCVCQGARIASVDVLLCIGGEPPKMVAPSVFVMTSAVYAALPGGQLTRALLVPTQYATDDTEGRGGVRLEMKPAPEGDALLLVDPKGACASSPGVRFRSDVCRSIGRYVWSGPQLVRRP